MKTETIEVYEPLRTAFELEIQETQNTIIHIIKIQGEPEITFNHITNGKLQNHNTIPLNQLTTQQLKTIKKSFQLTPEDSKKIISNKIESY